MRKKYEKYDNSFYYKLLDYLSEKHYPYLHWNSEYNDFGENTGTYGWWIEDTEIGGKGFSTLEELVEDIFLKIRYFAAEE
jgi:hypothetical protein